MHLLAHSFDRQRGFLALSQVRRKREKTIDVPDDDSEAKDYSLCPIKSATIRVSLLKQCIVNRQPAHKITYGKQK